MTRTRTATLSVALVAAAAAAGTLVPQSAGADDDPGLAKERTTASQFTSESAALAAGFRRTDDCTDWKHAKGIAPKGSYMGYHYVDPTRIDATLEEGEPEAVLYKRVGRDRVLAGIEYIVVDADQDLSTTDDRPSLHGHAFDGPMPGHFPGMPVHYDLHVWTHDDNPAGAWKPWNTSQDLNCP